MSKVIAITLSALILIQSLYIGTDDMMQLDELIAHAQFHKQEYGDSFFVFLSKHYGELKAEHSKKHQEEQKDHEELPFQCQSHSFTMIAFLPFCNTIEPNTLEIFNTIEFNFHYLGSHSSLHKKGLLQPPKYV